MWASTPTDYALIAPLRNITFLHLSQCAMTTSHPENSDEYCFRCRIFVAALLSNVINLKLFAKILGSMWASTPTDYAFIELCRRSSTPTNCDFIELRRWSSTPTDCAFIELHRGSSTPTDCAFFVSLCSVDFHTYRMVKFPYHTEKNLCNFSDALRQKITDSFQP